MRQTVEWAIELADVLHYLRTRTPPVLSTISSPANIGLDKRKRLRLIDFGIDGCCWRLTRRQGCSDGADHGRAARAVWTALQDDPRSDIYTLGATIYTLLSGCVPPEVWHRDGNSGAPISAYVPGVSPALEDAVS